MKSIVPYLAYEKVSIDLNSRLKENEFGTALNVLVTNNNLEAIKSAVEDYGMKIVEQEDALFIDESLSTVVLNVETNFDELNKLLTTFPVLITIE